MGRGEVDVTAVGRVDGGRSQEPPRSVGRPLTVTVFCSARSGTPASLRIAREVGRLLGENGHSLVYGGGGTGLMGELAWSAHRHGAQIVGVIPQFLYERERNFDAPSQILRITDTMCQRKDLMLDLADAFLALPGGFGTCDEILDVISLSCLHMHQKPLVLVQPSHEWQLLIDLLDRMVEHGYADSIDPAMLRVADGAEGAFSYLHDMVGVAA